MKALISPQEERTTFDGVNGVRVAEVQENTFEVASPLFWTDCPDNIIADAYLYVIETSEFYLLDEPPLELTNANSVIY